MSNKIEFRILTDIKDFESKFRDVNRIATNVTRQATIAFAAFGAAIGVSTKLAKEQQKVMNQTEAVIRSTGAVAGVTAESVFRLGKELQKVTTFGDEAIISTANMLLTFKEISSDVFPMATKAALDVSVAMNQGLKESAIQLGKALNDPILGITAMRRVGIQFTTEQEKQIKVLVETGRITKAQTLILKELESQFGGSAEAARKGLGAIDGFKNSIGDLAENVALVLAPAIEKIANRMTAFVDIVKENRGIVTLIAAFLALGVVISGAIIAVGSLIMIITSIGGAATAAIIGITTLLSGIATSFFLLNNRVDETHKSLNGEEGLFPKAKIGAEGLVEGLQTVKEKMKEVEDAGILLGTALTAGLGVGGIDLGRIPVKGSGGEESHPFTEGFASGLEEIKKKITDISQLGKDMALTLHSSFSTAISNMILGVQTVKEAFASFGRTMLEAIVRFIAEWIAFQLLSKAQAIIAQTFAITMAGTLAAAWAPAAALASLATLGGNAQPASAALIGTTALAHFLAIPKFAEGSAGMKDDTIGLFSKREIVIPATFSDAIRSGDLSLSGGGQQGPAHGGNIVMDFSNTVFNGITREFVEDIFKKAGESIKGRTLVFAGA